MSGRHERALAFLESLAQNSPQLPYEPDLLPELFAGTGKDSNASLDCIAALVNRSQGLAAQVLRRANSAYYGLVSAVSSLTRAIQVLGLNEVRAIVLSLGLSGAFKSLKLPPAFPLREIWEHQVLTAQIARETALFARSKGAQPLDASSPEELYAAGLLHDMGKALIAARCPEDWQAICELAAGQKLPFHLAEDAYWGLDHSVVGARILSFWELPARLTELVDWHHAPQLAEKPYQYGARLLNLANALAARAEEFRSGALTSMPAEAAAAMPPNLDVPALLNAVKPCFHSDKARDMAVWFTEK